MSRIIGIDPSSKTLAVVTDTWQSKVTVKKTQRYAEVAELQNHLKMILTAHEERPIIYCEEPVVAGARNLRSSLLVAETVGMVLGIGVPVHLVPVSTWKKEVCGKGNLNKEEVSSWLREYMPAYSERCDGDQDLVDATCIYLYGVKALGLSRQGLPQ